MFRQARIKLTAQYLLIIMVISLFFSAVIYRFLTSELNRIENAQRIRIQLNFPFNEAPRRFFIDPEVINETKNRIGLTLLVINLTILACSAVAGYYLAGETLKPIKNMVDEQNRFISDASHELKTPLTALKSEIEVNLRDKKLKLSEAKKLLKSNLEEVNHLEDLSNYLLKLNHLQSGDGLNIEAVSVLSIINTAIKKVNHLADSKNIKITNNISNQTIKGDLLSLSEVFIILLDNAIKYSPKNSEIKLFCQNYSQILAITIKDQGIGISQKNLPLIFDRFFQADNSRTKDGESGYGLGLSIAKKIIESHKGKIEVQSQLGKGSEFTVILPKLS